MFHFNLITSEIYTRAVKRAVYAGIYTPRNTFTWSLNGSPHDVLRGYENLVRCYHQTRGIAVDVSTLFGRSKEVYTTPEAGTFRVTVELGSDSIDFLIEGRFMWMRGFQGEWYV
uniref:Uncharacterized protein n=1 Tax=Arundo donax TaxID=35708 RepID=A0A0A9DRC8_ARUDO